MYLALGKILHMHFICFNPQQCYKVVMVIFIQMWKKLGLREVK